MSKPYVYVSLPISKEAEMLLAEHCHYRMWTEKTLIPRERLLEEVKQADGLITTSHAIDHELLQAAPNVQVVSNVSVGYNNFDLAAMNNRNVIGTHTPYVLDDSVADLIMALMLAAARRIPELDRVVKEGRWVKGGDELYYGTDVHHKKLGIIGMGRIGETVARRAKYGFDMEVQYYNRNRRESVEHELGVSYASFNELLATSDFIVLMTPLTEATKGLIGKEQFKLMKCSAIFINASRGQTVDELAMTEALQEGEIRAAGLDVFMEEPVPADHPLLRLDHVVTVPHIGSAVAKTRSDMAVLAVENTIAVLTGDGQAMHTVTE